MQDNSTKRPVIIICLGADVFALPGSSIVGGQAVFVRNLVQGLIKRRHTILITLYFSRLTNRITFTDRLLEIIDIPLDVSSCNAFYLWDNIEEIKNLCQAMLQETPFSNAIVITVYWISGIILSNLFRNSTHCWIHTYASYALQKDSPTSDYRYLKGRHLAEQCIAKEADYLWATCNYERELIIKNFSANPKKILFFPRTLDTTLFHSSQSPFPTPKWDILYVGRLDERKGVYDIPLILSKISKEYRLKIAILGGDEQETFLYEQWFQKYHQQVMRRHCIDIIPAVQHDDVPDYLFNSRILIVPSHHETFGNVVLEALACSVPVVASNVGGIPELITKKDHGLLFKQGDFSNAAACIEKILSASLNLIDNSPSLNRNWPVIYTSDYLIDRFEELF